jgi:hypothetical protein
MTELAGAVLGCKRAAADDEHEAVGCVDVVVDVLLPVRAGRDVFPVDPDLFAPAGQEGVELVDERAVDARVRDEDVRQDVNSPESKSTTAVTIGRNVPRNNCGDRVDRGAPAQPVMSPHRRRLLLCGNA